MRSPALIPLHSANFSGFACSAKTATAARRGLADDFADVAWRAYCPNAAMLNALGELPWFRIAAV
jgi:hypothetical protein